MFQLLPFSRMSDFRSSRRTWFALVAGLVMSSLPLGGSATAEPNANIAKVGIWMVGGQLGLASLVYFRNTGSSDQFFSEAKFRAKELGIEVKDFPPKPANSTDGIPMMLEYFNQGDGARIDSAVRQKYGAYHSTLYEIATRMYHMPLLYDLDPALGDKIAQAMRTNATKIRLPDGLWKPTTDSVAKRAKFDEVKAAVVKMDQDVMAYLIRVARGEEK